MGNAEILGESFYYRLFDLGICGVSHLALLYVVYLLFKDTRAELQRLRAVLGAIDLPIRRPLTTEEKQEGNYVKVS